MKLTRTAAAGLLASLVLFSGCESSQKGESTAMQVRADNPLCPITGNPVNPEIRTISHQGMNIGFCCADCPKKFAGMTTKQRDAAIAARAGM